MLEYDGCSDFLFEARAELLNIYPPDEAALKEIKEFIVEYALTTEDVKIVKNQYGMALITKIDVTLTMLCKWDISYE